MSKNTTIVLIRHGETQMNINGVFRGRQDYPLNENGVRQAQHLAEALAGTPFQAVYSSPLSRAVATGRPLAESHHLAVTPMAEFHNICLGEWEGRSKKDIQTQQPELWQQWVTCPEKLTVPGMESLATLQSRAREGLNKLIERHRGSAVAVVTHRSVLKAAMAVILGLEHSYFWRFYFDNASFSIVEHRPETGFIIKRLNENCHLDRVIEEVF